MIAVGGKITISGTCIDNTSGSLVGPRLDVTCKIIRGLKNMVHPDLQQAKFTGVASHIDLSLFVGLTTLTELQFVDCHGLSCSPENFAAMADLLQSGVKIELSTGNFPTRYNEYATANGKIILPESSHAARKAYARVQQLRHQVVYSNNIPSSRPDVDHNTPVPEHTLVTSPDLDFKSLWFPQAQ